MAAVAEQLRVEVEQLSRFVDADFIVDSERMSRAGHHHVIESFQRALYRSTKSAKQRMSSI